MRTWLAVALLASSQVWAATLRTPAELRADVEPYLAKPLPSVTSIVGIAMPRASPMVVVASFGDVSVPDDGDRGYAFGRTLNELLFGAHRELDVETPYYYSLDTRAEGVTAGRARDSRGNAYRVAQRESGQWCVYGDVEGGPAAYRVSVMVDRCVAGSAATRKVFAVASDADWPLALRAICEHVVTVAANLSPRAQAACARGAAVRPATFLAYARFAATRGMPYERLDAIVAEDPTFAPTAIEFIERLPEGTDKLAFLDRVDAIIKGAGSTPAVAMAGYSRQLVRNAWKIGHRPFAKVLAVIRANPQLRGPWLLLASSLSYAITWDDPTGFWVVDWVKGFVGMEGARYYPNEATHTAALAISLDYYATWPESYRARWQIGYALMQYAWMVRGNETWDKVPRAGKRAWKPLMRLADAYTVAAIEAQPAAVTLWANRINTVYHTGGDWLLVFDTAAQAHPRASQVYEAAMRYAQPKWGGSDIARTHVQNAAVTNNPDAEWAKTLIDRHAATGTL